MEITSKSYLSLKASTLRLPPQGWRTSIAMVAGGMEQLRLGIAGKLMYVVPNHMIDQFAADFLRLYPAANVLITREQDFEKQRRQQFIAKIATADIDAVVLGHSQFTKLAISPKRQVLEIEHELRSLEHALEHAELGDTPRYTIKKMEKAKLALSENMKSLLDASRKDTMLYFEQLGVDSLFIDEAHNFKNGAIHSKMSNVAGVSDSSSQKAADLLAKTRYLAEIGGCVTFATGTPISNSVCEMYVMQRYLQEAALHRRGIHHFDEWASDFGETVSSIELKPEGGGFRSITRFSQFFNLPELMSMFREVADIQTADMLDLPTPKLHSGKPIIVACEPSEALLRFMDDCVYRAERIRNGAVRSDEDNMLKLTTEARKAGTDIRLLDPNAPSDPGGKIAACAQRIYQQYLDTQNISGTELVFSDIGTPNKHKFNVYDELLRQLVELGIPEDELAFIHDAKSALQKETLFADMRSGKKRVLVGSTQKCGAGTNIQERLVALHHLDCPWRPSDIEQREGRILRQGNDNTEVFIYRYVTKKSFDSYLWQLVEQKQRFISQVMSGKLVGRTCQDIDETVLSFAEVKAIATGDPRMRQRMELEMDVAKLRMLKQQHNQQKYEQQNRLQADFPNKLQELRQTIDAMSKDRIALYETAKAFSMQIDGKLYTERVKAGEALLAKMPKAPLIGKDLALATYRGMALSLAKDGFGFNHFAVQGHYTYYTDTSGSAIGCITRIENLMEDIENQLLTKKHQFKALQTDMEETEQQAALPFEQENELVEKQSRLVELTADISEATGVAKGSPEQVQEEYSTAPKHDNAVSY